MKLNSKKNFGNEKLIRKEVGRISTSFFFSRIRFIAAVLTEMRGTRERRQLLKRTR